MGLQLERLCLLVLLSPGLLVAQETTSEATGIAQETRASEIEDFEPAVSSQELAAGTPASTGDVAPRAVLASDVTRDEAGNVVMDRIDLGRTEITGNQELPKVLYIVPWKKSDPGDLMGKPVNTLLDEVLAPIDRSEFMRQVDYYGDLQGKAKE